MAITRPRANQIGSGNVVNEEYEFIDTLDQNIGKDDSVQFAGLTIAPASGTTAAIINSNSDDYDTIIRGDTDDNLFYVNAGLDRVGIGVASPGAKLDIYTATTADGVTVYDTCAQSSINTGSINGGTANNYGFTAQAYGGADGSSSVTINNGLNCNAFGAAGTNGGNVSNRAISCWAANGDTNYAIYISAGDVYSENGSISLANGNVSATGASVQSLTGQGGGGTLKIDLGFFGESAWVYANATNHDDEVLWTRRTWKGNVVLPIGTDVAGFYGEYKENGTVFLGYTPYLNDSNYYGGIYDGGYMAVPAISNGLMFVDETEYANSWVKIDGTNGNVLIATDNTFVLVPRYKLDVDGVVRLQGTNQLTFGGNTTSDYTSSIYDDTTAVIITRGDDIVKLGTTGEPLKIQSATAPYVSFYNSTPARVGYIGDGFNDGNIHITSDSGSIIINESGASTCDFRVEGDAAENLLFIDASEDRVGINTATPDYRLDVRGRFGASDTVTTSGTHYTHTFGGTFIPSAASNNTFRTGYFGLTYNNSTGINTSNIAAIEAAPYIAGTDWIGQITGLEARVYYSSTNNAGGNSLYAIKTGYDINTASGQLEHAMGVKVQTPTISSTVKPGINWGIYIDDQDCGITDSSAIHIAAGDSNNSISFGNAGSGKVSSIYAANSAKDVHIVPDATTGKIVFGGGSWYHTATKSLSLGVDLETAQLYVYQTATSDALCVNQSGTGTIAEFRTASTDIMMVYTSGVVINEDGAAIDTRIEGDTDTNLLFCDASAEMVGIGTNFPGAKLYVYNTTAAEDGFIVNNYSSGSVADFRVSGSSKVTISSTGYQTNKLGVVINDDGEDSDTRIEGNTDANLLFIDAGTDRVGIGTNGPATKLDVVGATRTGDSSTNYTNFDTTGHQTMAGDARPWRDELGELLGKKRIGARITEDLAEGVLLFSDSCQIADDYVITNVQLNHDKDLAASIYPHIHWFQASSSVPNWLIQYRWQTASGTKTTSWTSLACNTQAFTYTSGTIHQVSYASAISVPGGTGLSDIVQFRICRDTDNDSSQFSGADPLTGNASAMMFDIHFMTNSVGSTDQYTK